LASSPAIAVVAAVMVTPETARARAAEAIAAPDFAWNFITFTPSGFAFSQVHMTQQNTHVQMN
jgi:hypothetical protein